MLKSKAMAWAALALVLIIIIMTFPTRTVWWSLFDVFFAFMMVFCHIMSLYIVKMSPAASRKMDIAALVFGVLMILALIVEFILFQVEF